MSEISTPNSALSYTREIEVRLAEPRPSVRYEKGRPVREPAPDMERVVAAVTQGITQGVQGHFGEDTRVVITVGRSADIRLTGTFAEKSAKVKEIVGEVLETVFADLELGE